jgi:hypothetical protein
MKKPGKRPVPAKHRKPAAGSSEVNQLLDMLQQMEPDLLRTLEHVIRDGGGFYPGMFDAPDAVELFADYLDFCEARVSGMDPDIQQFEHYPDLVTVLSDIRICANGGDHLARDDISEINDLLDEAIEDSALHLIDLVFTGKILSDAGWDVPQKLREATSECIRDARSTAAVGEASHVNIDELLPLQREIRNNPFELHEFLNSIFAAFVSDAIQMFCIELATSGKPEVVRAIMGFILHPESGVAAAVADSLASSARARPAESVMIERLVRMRPWLPQERQSHVDAAIKAMRQNAGPPVKLAPPKLIKCMASVCDGSGTRSLYVSQRKGGAYQLATVMIKPAGIMDAVVFSGMNKTDMDLMLRQLKSSVLCIETDLAGIARMLALALGENATSGKLPPFKLVEVVESLGLGPILPSGDAPADIIAGLLEGSPPEETDTAAISRAHREIAASDFAEQWFEAGEAVEDLLYPVKGHQKRVTKLMKTYMEERRQFWARQCAISALALRGAGQANLSLSRKLAIVGRDIASGTALDKIPLMQHVAQQTVRSFEARF